MLKHGRLRRNALIPILTVGSLTAAVLISGAVVTETVGLRVASNLVVAQPSCAGTIPLFKRVRFW